MRTRLVLLISIIFSGLNISAEIPEKAIPFILDSHVYIQGVIADTIPVSLIYDTGADRLYMDKDYMDLSTFGKLPLRKARAKMGGAGNDGVKTVPIIIDTIPLQMGDIVHKEHITPIINLREILGRYADGEQGVRLAPCRVQPTLGAAGGRYSRSDMPIKSEPRIQPKSWCRSSLYELCD